MASMIPHVLAPETPDSERRMYELFRDKLPGAWKAIHGQRFLLPSKHRIQEGELDFLLLDPARGALGLEVKDGREGRTSREAVLPRCWKYTRSGSVTQLPQHDAHRGVRRAARRR